jgi:hypothetical protein
MENLNCDIFIDHKSQLFLHTEGIEFEAKMMARIDIGLWLHYLVEARQSKHGCRCS